MGSANAMFAENTRKEDGEVVKQEPEFQDGRFTNLDLAGDDSESVLGRAIVIHGTDGSRVACGVIGLRQDAVFDLPDLCEPGFKP